jgi:hypothetical protein
MRMNAKPRNDELPRPLSGPEVSLWYQVLSTGLDDLHGSDREREDAEAWFKAETDGIASFLWVCEVLGISASAIRRRLGFNLKLPQQTFFLPVLGRDGLSKPSRDAVSLRRDHPIRRSISFTKID